MIRRKPGSLCDSSEHARTYFFVIVEGENEIRPRGAFKRPMRAGLAFDFPTDPQEGGQHSIGFGGGPVAQAA